LASPEGFMVHVLASEPEYSQPYFHLLEWTWSSQKIRPSFARDAS
jgi:hypothetical protein